MSTDGNAAVEGSAPFHTDPVRPGRAKALSGKESGSAALLFGAALASVLINVAQERGSRQAERLANEVPRTELAPRFDPALLPEKTADGRTIPREPRLQVGNVLQKLWDRGELPDPATVKLSLSFATIKLVAMEIAALDQGCGCWMSLRKLEKKLNRDERTIREVCEYLRKHVGNLLTFGRVRADDRKIGGAREPVTEQRTTVRLMFAIPRPLAGRLSYEEVLDLIAAGEQKPVAELADLDGAERDRGASAEPAPEPTPRQAPRRAVVTPAPLASPPPQAAPKAPVADSPAGVPPAKPAKRPGAPPAAAATSANTAPTPPLVQVLERIRELTGHQLAPSWILERAAEPDARLDADQVLEAMADLEKHLAEEKSGMAAMGKRWRAPKAERLLGRAAKYLTGKRDHIDKNGPQARATDESKAREADYRAECKTPEQNYRESGEARHAAAPQDLGPTRAQKEQRLRFEIDNEMDPVRKARLVTQLHAFFPAPAPARPPPAVSQVDGLRLAYLGELATIEMAELGGPVDANVQRRKGELLGKLAGLPPPPRGPPE